MAEGKPTVKDILSMASEIVAAQAGSGNIDKSEIPGLIRQVYDSLASVASVSGGVANAAQPAVAVEESVTPDYIVCLEDGKKLKMLKRHLMASFGMTPEEYRKRWGLPVDYPMVAPNYAKRRSSLAKTIGLGRRPSRTRKAKTAAPAQERSVA